MFDGRSRNFRSGSLTSISTKRHFCFASLKGAENLCNATVQSARNHTALRLYVISHFHEHSAGRDSSPDTLEYRVNSREMIKKARLNISGRTTTFEHESQTKQKRKEGYNAITSITSTNPTKAQPVN